MGVKSVRKRPWRFWNWRLSWYGRGVMPPKCASWFLMRQSRYSATTAAGHELPVDVFPNLPIQMAAPLRDLLFPVSAIPSFGRLNRNSRASAEQWSASV